MIAMQYQFIFPADYPMEKIEQRIREKGHVLDGLPGLIFKAYLYARKGDGSDVNCYAPFYVWKETSAMAAFLQSEGFKALCEQFGRPEVKSWLITEPPTPPGPADTRALMGSDGQRNADVTGFDSRLWQPLEVHWLSEEEIESNGPAYFRIGYVAIGGAC